MGRSILLDNDGEPVYNRGVDIKQLIKELPAGLERGILDVLQFHIGHENAISRTKLLNDLGLHGFHFDDDRKVRLCISQMRKEGQQICSTGGEDGGYWLGAGKEEVFEFTSKEYRSRALDMLETAKAMEDAAEKRWGRYSPEKQINMF